MLPRATGNLDTGGRFIIFNGYKSDCVVGHTGSVSYAPIDEANRKVDSSMPHEGSARPPLVLNSKIASHAYVNSVGSWQ